MIMMLVAWTSALHSCNGPQSPKVSSTSSLNHSCGVGIRALSEGRGFRSTLPLVMLGLRRLVALPSVPIPQVPRLRDIYRGSEVQSQFPCSGQIIGLSMPERCNGRLSVDLKAFDANLSQTSNLHQKPMSPHEPLSLHVPLDQASGPLLSTSSEKWFRPEFKQHGYPPEPKCFRSADLPRAPR